MINTSNIGRAVFYGLVLVTLILLTENFLLFHAYAEGFSIVIAVLMFVVTWNGREYIDNYYLHFVGIAYLFVANLDFLHTLGFSGMNIFKDYDFYANQLWVVARALESGSLVAGFFFLNKKGKFNEITVVVVYTLISAAAVVVVLVLKVFPECFVAGVGQTPFKIVSEIVIMGVLGVALLLLRKNRHSFADGVYKSLAVSMVLTIISELFFTIYIHNYGLSNVLGHYVKIVSFYLIYRSIVEMGIQKPYKVIFNNLETKKEQLEVLNAEKTKLFSIVAHDLRNPFNVLIGLSDSLHNDYDELTDDDRRMYIEHLHRAADTMGSLTENLLEWARINLDTRRLVPAELSLCAHIRSTVAPLDYLAQAKALTIRVDCSADLCVVIDGSSLGIVIRNLVMNAIKYSPPDGAIDIRARSDGETVVLEIVDRGRGMSQADLERIVTTSAFASQRGTNGEKGSGLGMKIVKEHVELNHGTLAVVGGAEPGTTVQVRFPRRQ